MKFDKICIWPIRLRALVHEQAALTLHQVAGAASSRLWNEHIARYHYLGYTLMAGSQIRYFVFEGERLLALPRFGVSAWKLAARDRFIGWDDDERQENLPLVENNARFLILPWIGPKGLASKILSIINRKLLIDWHQRYGYRPVLLETFVEIPRHRGICYKAANWINVRKTSGRGKNAKPISRSCRSKTSGSIRYARTSVPFWVDNRKRLGLCVMGSPNTYLQNALHVSPRI